MCRTITAVVLTLISGAAIGQTDCGEYVKRIDAMMREGNYDASAMQRAAAIKQQITTVCQMGGPQMADRFMAELERDLPAAVGVREDAQHLSTDELTDEYLRGPWCLGRIGEGEVSYFRFRDDGSIRLGINSMGLQGAELRAHMDAPGELPDDRHGDFTYENRDAFLARMEIRTLVSRNADSFVAIGRHNSRLEFTRGACWE